jgi:glycosyltransferase involved in cell wall biosynthesis
MLHTVTVSGVVAPGNFIPRGNFIAGGQSRRLVEIDRHYDNCEAIWQQDIYQFARTLADDLQPRRVVDLGAGTGSTLHAAFRGHTAQQLQTDWRDEREPLPDGAPFPDFLAVNLEDYHDLESLEAALDPNEPTLFILADVIEHLQDPRPVLRTLRRLLKRNPVNRLVMSTPDRCRLDGTGSVALPDNPGHIRQWTLNEFGLAMMSAGFVIQKIGRLRQNQYDPHDRAICCELSCTPEFYSDWLSHHELPPAAQHLVITTEHAKLERTGGIGTYVQLAAEADGHPRLVLLAGAMGLPEAGWSKAARSFGLLHVADICGGASRPLHEISTPDPDEILQAVNQTLFLYDDVRLIEYQDYLGIGYRVAQAKRAGLLPPSITVLAYAHGNQLYLDAAGGTVRADRPLRFDTQERLSVELADVVAFASNYLRNLYVNEGGFRIRSERHLPYPVLLGPAGLDDLSRGPIRNLVFYGKQTHQKGYYDFVQAVLELFSDPAHAAAAERVQRIVLMGVTDPDVRLKALPVTIEHGVWSRRTALGMLRRFAADSLLVLPYRGDNHPLSVIEVVDCDCPLVAFDVGGVPEILPAELKDLLLCAPNPASLAAAMARAVALNHWERCRLVERTRKLMCEAYAQHVDRYKATMDELRRGVTPSARSREPGAITVVVPNLNGTRVMLEDVARGLRNSFHRPEKIILVDDGSTHEGKSVIEKSLPAFGDLPVEVVHHPENRGLAAARNTGLARVQTPYFCAHDNDNIVLNRFLQIACRILDANPQIAAVTCWLRFFEDGAAWQSEKWGAGYRPIGADLGYALRMNSLGDALGVYRVSALREIGGWNESSKAKWEDWECYLRLLVAGKDIWVIPQEQFLYRVRPESMARGYPEFPGWLRLTNVLNGVPKAHAVSLLRAIWTPSVPENGDLVSATQVTQWLRERVARLEEERARLEQERARLEQDRAQLQSIEASTTWRATARLRRLLSAHPETRRVLRGALSSIWRSTRYIRSAKGN